MLSNERIEEIRQRDGNTNTPMTTVEEERRELLGHMSAQQARIDALTEQRDSECYWRETYKGAAETLKAERDKWEQAHIELRKENISLQDGLGADLERAQEQIRTLTEQLKAADVEKRRELYRNDFDLYLQEKVGLVETIRTLTEELHETRIERNIIFNLDMEHQARIEQQEITIRTMTRLVSKFMQTDEAEAISEIHPGQNVIRFMPRSPRRDEPV